MKYLARVVIVAGALTALFVTSAADAARKPKDILQYIPADTPYVIAFTEPMPDEVIDKFEPALEDIMSAYRTMVDTIAEQAMAESSQLMAEAAGEEEPVETPEEILALMDEVLGIMSIEGLESAGIGRDALFALYGDGLLPVMRFALSDGAKFDATITRFEEAAGKAFATAELKGVSYRYQDIDEKMRLIISVDDDDAVVTLVPIGYDDDRLMTTLGIKKPRKNLHKSKDLAKIAKANGFTDHMVSFIDVERIAATFLGDPSGLNAELLSLAEYDASKLDDTCRAEFTDLAAIAPRVVFGYTELSTEKMDTRMVVELREDIAKGLATLPAVVPGLGPDLGGLFTFGFSLDPMALRSFYEARLDAMEADPFECAALAELQGGVAKGREVLAQPIPPMVYSFRGMLANITNIEGMDMANDKPPESVDGSFLFAMENAQDVVNMAALMSPEIAALGLMPDGKAKRLELPQLAELGQEIFAALGGNGLAVSIGEGGGEPAEAMLAAESVEPAPLMTFSMDAKRYYDFIGDAVMAAEDKDEELPEEFKQSMRDVMTASGSLYERISANVHLNERGIQIDSSVKLAD